MLCVISSRSFELVFESVPGGLAGGATPCHSILVEPVVVSFSLTFGVWPLNKEQEIRTLAYDVFHHGGTIIHHRESFELSQGLWVRARFPSNRLRGNAFEADVVRRTVVISSRGFR